jgi:two-component system CheB/CheR fusion protein
MAKRKRDNPQPLDGGQANSPFPVVGIGASAGGLEAFSQMLHALPVDTGMAFVLVQHLSPTHASLLAEILSKTTEIRVTEVQDEPRVEPNRVYVIPPNRNMILSRGVLQLLPREEARGQHRPIDFFFHSLAEDQKDRAIGVILSGTATDGTLGLEEIKAEGGITFAQDDTAQQDSMPRSAIASGCVDFVLSPAEIAKEIGRISRHPYVAAARRKAPVAGQDASALPDNILETVRRVTGVDFTRYKATSVNRRINRRMILHKIAGVQEYARFLRETPGEAEALYQDILIPVTRFFRDPEAFEALKATVLPKLFKDRSPGEPLRVWVLGCSTGQEAYSLAILFVEFAEATGSQLPIQVFATDLNAAGIDKARAGVYPPSITHDVSPERLRRFFSEVNGGYRISKTIRDLCVFARHNVLTDPPFSQIDLISCRNLLIYLEPALQQKVLPLLHYALKPAGFLFLGSSETIGSYRDLFEAADARHKSYAKKPSARRMTFGQAARSRQGRGRLGGGPDPSEPARADAQTPQGVQAVQKEADRILLARYVPPSVLVDTDLEILQFRGDTGPYLAPAPGKASLNLLRMARPELAVTLRAAVNKARKEAAPVREEGFRVEIQGETREVHLEVIPVKASPAGEKGGFLVLFEAPSPATLPGKTGRVRKPRAGKEATEGEIDRLTQELAAAREYLQSVIEQQETANEELQSANEEAQSANEELQSINEELETSKEEIQSSNEELATVNDELQNRNAQLNLLNNDLARAREYAESIVATVREPLLVLDADLCVRTASQSFYRTFRETPETTENRFLYDLGGGQWNIPELRRLLEAIQRQEDAVDGYEVEQEFEHIGRKTMLLNARRIFQEGSQQSLTLLAIEDITARKELETALRQRVEELAAADRSKNEFLALLAHELRNPLAPLRNAAHVLEAAGADRAAVEQARTMMNRQIENMRRLIEDLLDVSRVTRGEVRLRKERIELTGFLRHTVEMTRHLIAARGLELSLSLPDEPAYLDADPTRLDQIFGNLLNNASKFTPKGGHLWVTAEMVSDGSHGSHGSEIPGEVVVRVRDDGRGMAPDTLPRIFDLFMQADRSYDRSGGGLGIGLTLVRRLVELHGGSVEAHSAGLGQGSEFVVRLPVSARAPEARRHDDLQRLADSALVPVIAPPRRILVVDDNVDTAESLALLLRLRGQEVKTAYDGPAALKMAASFLPDVVLLDIGLPGLDGYQVAARLRRRRRTAGALLVALTGYGQEEDQRLAHEAGFDHHLTKPVDPRAIYELIGSSRA